MFSKTYEFYDRKTHFKGQKQQLVQFHKKFATRKQEIQKAKSSGRKKFWTKNVLEGKSFGSNRFGKQEVLEASKSNKVKEIKTECLYVDGVDVYICNYNEKANITANVFENFHKTIINTALNKIVNWGFYIKSELLTYTQQC